MKKQESKIWTIIKHEYTSKVKSKGFIISSILGPLILVLIFGVSIFASIMSVNEISKKVSVVDKSGGEIGEKLVKRDKGLFVISETDIIDSLRQKVLDEKIDAFLVIPADFIEKGKATIYSKGGGGFGFTAKIDNHLDAVLRLERLQSSGVDSSIVKLIESDADIVAKKITESGNVEKDYTTILAGLGYFLGFFIYIMLLIYGQYVSRGVIEEKANRIIEVLASSAKPIQIMLGKVLGIGMLGLTQIVFWIVMGFILMMAAGPVVSSFMPDSGAIKQGMDLAASQSAMPFEIPSIPLGIIVAFVYYFIIGYFMYSTVFAAVGSAVDQESDAAQLQQPIIFAIIIPILFLMPVSSNPDSTLAVVLSLIPFFTPILMTVRIAATEVPLWQIVASVVLTVGTFFLLLWIAAKIYRVGILMYGKKPKLKDLIKWVRLAK